jgi:hypothetical protein
MWLNRTQFILCTSKESDSPEPEAKDENPAQQQTQGRAAILNNFKLHLEGKCEATGPAR